MTDRSTDPDARQADPSMAHDGRFDITGLGTSQGRGLRWLSIVVAIFVVAELCARLVAAAVPDEIRWYDAAMQLRVEMIDELVDDAAPGAARVDVVFAGPSSAWQALVPSAFSAADPERRSAFNAGLDGGVPSVTAPWLLDHVVDRVEPDLVVWGLTPLDIATGFGDAPRAAFDDAVALQGG